MKFKTRKVIENWEHPRLTNGEYKPLKEGRAYREVQIAERGVNRKRKNAERYVSVKDPNRDTSRDLDRGMESRDLDTVEFTPDWEDDVASHYMMYDEDYEDGGIPISPVCETIDELANFMEQNDFDVHENMKANVNQWARIVKNGYDNSCIREMTSGEIIGFIE